MVIHKYGGIYNDQGNTYIKQIDEVIKTSDRYVSILDFLEKGGDANSSSVNNCMLAAYRYNPIVEFCLDHLINNVRTDYYGVNFLG
jgi:mannosyltransferase OCH1-like enzyme